MAKDYNEGSKVETMVALGLTHEQIAYVLKMTAKTLRKHYGKELKNGKSKVDAMIGGQLVKKAINGDTVSIIFYLKTKCGWKEQVDVNVEQLPRLKAIVQKIDE